jgi:tetratricopeptide (TPR) repeat protein
MRGYGGRAGVLGGIGLTLALLVGSCSSTLTQVSNQIHEGLEAQRAYTAGVDRYAAREYAAAIPYFQRALSLYAAFDDAGAYLAWSYYYVGSYQDAIRHFRHTLASQPTWEGLYDGLGWSRYQLQRYHLAAEAFQRALELNPRYRDAAVGLAYSLFESARYTDSFPLLERLTREGEGSAFQHPTADVEDVRCRLAWTLFYLGRYAEAQAEFSKGIAAHSDWYGLYNGLGWTSLKLGDRVRALQSFQKALGLMPGYADAKVGLAQARQ